MENFGELLRHWRKSRGLSQLDLSLAADISTKHLSFLETGRSNPSKDIIVHLCISLDIPLAERNHLLLAAGFSEAYRRTPLNQPEMQPIKEALTTLLNSHEPYPAAVFDWDWNMLMANPTHQRLVEILASQQPDFPETANILELMFDQNGFRPFIVNWEEAAGLILQRLRREKTLYADRKSDLLERLLQYPDLPAHFKHPGIETPPGPMVSLQVEMGDQVLSLFSTLSTFGTAIDITAQELTIEQYFPADSTTKAILESL